MSDLGCQLELNLIKYESITWLAWGVAKRVLASL